MTKTVAVIRRPLMSGHCRFPQTRNPEESHARCAGFNVANPKREFQPCPCACHYTGERYECAGCGGTITATTWPLDSDGDTRYTHLDSQGNALGEECT